MSLKDHAVSFGIGAVHGALGSIVSTGGIAASFAAHSHGVISETGTALGVLASSLYYVSCCMNTALAADGAPFMKAYWDSDQKLSRLSGFKSQSFALGSATTLAAPFALIYNLASNPPSTLAVPEQTAPAIEQHKPSPPLPEGSTVYQSTSSPVTIPKGLKVG